MDAAAAEDKRRAITGAFIFLRSDAAASGKKSAARIHFRSCAALFSGTHGC